MRERIRAEVSRIAPFDAEERTTIHSTLAWIDSDAELCRRIKPDTPPKHLVAYFPVMDGPYILLVEHRNAGLWLPTGGHVEPGEHPRTTVEREVLEELSIKANFLNAKAVFLSQSETVGRTAGHTDVCLWYALRGDRHARYDADLAEFYQIKWFHHDDVPFERSDPNLMRFLKKLSEMNTK